MHLQIDSVRIGGDLRLRPEESRGLDYERQADQTLLFFAEDVNVKHKSTRAASLLPPSSFALVAQDT